VPVQVQAVEGRDLARVVSASTTLRSAREVTVVAETSGTVRDVLAETGARVATGDVLARIVNEELEIGMAEARDALQRAEREVERLRPLFESGYLARQAFEAAEFERTSAESAVARLRAQADALTVRSPGAGVVISRSVEPGAVVVPNQALFVVADVDALEARLALPERELLGLAVGQPAQVIVEALAGEAIGGRVSRIEPTVDPRSGTIEVRVALDSVDGSGGRLRPGMFAAVRIVTDLREGVAAVPKRSIVREAGTNLVYVLNEADVEPAHGALYDGMHSYGVRQVEATLGYEDREWVQIVSGLEIGDRVIVVGQSGIDSSSRVVVPAERGDEGSGAGG
jgi:RND family efflux transporter MFP subunit